MARGDYSRRVQATSQDEVGQLAAPSTRWPTTWPRPTGTPGAVANVSPRAAHPGHGAAGAVLENIVDGVSEPDPVTLRPPCPRPSAWAGWSPSCSTCPGSRPGANLEITDLRLRDFLRARLPRARRSSAGQRLRFPVVVVPEDLTVPADRDRLHQVVANLLDNAVRHSPEDGRSACEASVVGGDVRIDVVDDGPGIARDERAHVFERFTPGRDGRGRRRHRARPGHRPLGGRSARRHDPVADTDRRAAGSGSYSPARQPR